MAYDAFTLAAPQESIPYSLTAKGIGQNVSHLTLEEQQRLKHLNLRYGLGDLNRSVWLFAILTVGCAVATVIVFLE